jgi:hypothetical protein
MGPASQLLAGETAVRRLEPTFGIYTPVLLLQGMEPSESAWSCGACDPVLVTLRVTIWLRSAGERNKARTGGDCRRWVASGGLIGS